MTEVYLLWHSYGDHLDKTAKLVGVYSSRASAEAAILRKLQYPGSQDHPAGFLIDPYTLDRDYWSEGFGLSDIDRM